MFEDFAPFDDKRTGCCITTMNRHTFFFTKEFFTRTDKIVVPQTPYFSLFPRLKIKLRGRHLDTIEVIEAESQAVLTTLTDHDFQDAFKEIL
jgi:hypothetical protein